MVARRVQRHINGLLGFIHTGYKLYPFEEQKYLLYTDTNLRFSNRVYSGLETRLLFNEADVPILLEVII